MPQPVLRHQSLLLCISVWCHQQADVLNRGNGGYTTATAQGVLAEMLSSTLPHQRVLLATVLLGTNDAALPGSPQ